MGKYTLVVSSRARKELQAHHKSGNQRTIKKIEQIFLELSETPYSGIGNPEPLKYHLAGYWSRRLNKQDRIVYKVIEETVQIFIVSAIGHYDDK
jgi:toxin YoeB